MESRFEKYDFLEFDNIDSSDFTYNFPSNNPLILGESPEIALKSFMVWFEVPNISQRYDNNSVRIKYKNVWIPIVIPEGMYEIRQLSNMLNRIVILGRSILHMNEPEPDPILQLDVDVSTFHCLVRLSEGVKIDFTDGNLHKLLGLENRIYSSSERGKSFINITRGVDKIYINCNLVERAFQHELKNVLYTILPIASPGQCLMQDIENIEFYPCNSKFIRSIRIQITDQNGNHLHLSESYNIKLILRHHVTIK